MDVYWTYKTKIFGLEKFIEFNSLKGVGIFSPRVPILPTFPPYNSGTRTSFLNNLLVIFCTAYKCHGSWKDNGTMHQIISSDLPSAVGWKKMYCLAYVKWPPDRLQVFVYADNCNTNNNRTGTVEGLVLSFNISLSPSGKPSG